MPDEPEVEQIADDKSLLVLRNRYQEARRAGLSIVEAQLFRDQTSMLVCSGGA
jgi:hypothetical protein